MPETRYLAAALSPDERRLALLEREHLVAYRWDSTEIGPVETSRTELALLRQRLQLTFTAQRSAPLAFAADSRRVIVVLEPDAITREGDADGAFEAPDAQHGMGILDAETGSVDLTILYEGMCRALAELPEHGQLAIGFGRRRVFIFDPTGKESRGSYWDSSGFSGVVLVSMDDGHEVGRLVVPPADLGVTALAFDPVADTLVVGCGSGRVRIASRPTLTWLASLCLTDSILSVSTNPDGGQILAIDDGGANTHSPRLHTLMASRPSLGR
jgi:hypothetical protein